MWGTLLLEQIIVNIVVVSCQKYSSLHKYVFKMFIFICIYGIQMVLSIYHY